MARRWLKIGSGIAAGIVTLVGLFILLQTNFGFQINDVTGNIVCEGTYENPCISEFIVKNPTKYDVDIYSADQVKLDFSPEIEDYALFVKDGRCGATGNCACDLKDGREIGFKGWRCVDFTNKTKPLEDKEYNFRFVAYSSTNFRLAGIKNDASETVKWGFRANTSYLDPFWYGINGSATTLTTSMIVELGTVINISGNITGAATVCVDIDHPSYNTSYKCGTPTVNFLLNISYFRNDVLNGSETAKNLTWTGAGNQTAWIRQHQYDEILNFSMNLTAYNYTIVKIYVNNTLSNVVGELFNGMITLDELGGEYPVAGDINEGLTGSSVGSCYAAYPCSNAWDHNWTNFSAAASAAVNISINYTIPDEVVAANVSVSLWGNSAPKYVTTYCLNGGTAIFMGQLDLDVLDPTNYSFSVNKSCFDNEINLTVIYGITDLDRIYETEIQWFTGAASYNFQGASTNTFTINISSKANVTSAYWNITGLLVDNILSEKQDSDITGASQLYTGNYYWSQSFKPVYKNLSKLAFPLSKLGTPSSDITVNIGTTVNGTEIATATIPEANVPLAAIEWVEVDLNTNLTVGTTYYITLLGSYTGGYYFWYRSATDTSPYANGNATTNIVGVNFDMGFRTYINKYPEGIVMEIGEVDGVYEWNYSAEYTTTNRTRDLSSAINNYTANCTSQNGNCIIPGYISSQTPGTILLSAIEINYTTNSNPIYLNHSLIQDFLDHSINFTNVPIRIESDRAAKIQVSGISLDYKGGNDTIHVFLFQSGTRSNNLTLNMTYYYSDFIKLLPYSWTSTVFFTPRTNSSKNVSAYGQTSTKPIFNITTTNYGGNNMNISIRLNQTYSCINITWNATGSSKPSSQKLNTSWQKIAGNLAYKNNTNIWLWADLEKCNALTDRILNPEIYVESYCLSCKWEGS